MRATLLRLPFHATCLGLAAVALAAVTYQATYTLNGGSANRTNESFSATAADTSAVWATNSGALTLVNPTIVTSGNTSSQDNSSFYGLNAGILASAKGSIHMTGGTITTGGTGANGAFATDSGSSVTITDATIKASADGGHAVMATNAGTMTLTNVDMTTSGGSSSAVATDRGGGTIQVTGGTVRTSGGNSAGLYSTGNISATGTTFVSTGAEMAVIEGSNSITLNNCALSSTKEKWGVMLYQSMSGDAQGVNGVFTMTGGSLNYSPTAGPLFYVNNSIGNITLSGVALTVKSGVFLKAAAGSWGTSGSNGGTVVLTATGQTIAGNIEADSISAVTATLKANSALTGAVNAAGTAKSVALTLDASSTWTLTADSNVTSFTDPAISGSTVTNVTGNGHNLYYDASASANSTLGGGTFSLVNGGLLLPKGSAGTVCSYAATASATTFTASGGAGTVAVTSSSGCAWTAASSATWLTVSSGSASSGSGSVSFSVAANSSADTRTATLTVAGKTISITQAGTGFGGGCSYVVSPSVKSLNAGSGSFAMAVTATAGCTWAATSDAYWLTFDGTTSGTGSGSVTVVVAANVTGDFRTGTITLGSATATISQSPLGSIPLAFVPITPCRVFDTKSTSQLAAGETREVAVRGGTCPVPAEAAAYSVNATVTPAQRLSYLTVWPSGLTQPGTYTMTSVDGRVRSAASIVAAGTGGAVKVYAPEATDVALDINGYFVPSSGTTTALAYYPVTPCRLVDTRLSRAELGSPALIAGQSRTFPLAGNCNLPSTAGAYALNIAVVPKAGKLSSLSVWATGQTRPEVATMSAPTGAVTANAVLVAAGTAGSVDLYAAEEAEVIIDVNGYFAAPDSTGLYFYPVNPCRMGDTTAGTGETQDLAATQCGAPADARAYSVTLTALPVTTLGYLSLWPTGTVQPLVATLNASDGVGVSNAAVAGAGSDGKFSVFVTNPTHILVDLTGYFGL